MRVTALIPAAGRGKRLKARASKALVCVAGKPILIHTLLAVSKHPLIRDIIVAAHVEDIGRISKEIKKYKIRKIKGIVAGGQRRQDSVANCLNALAADCQMVLIHDAARPFISRDVISAVVKAAGKFGAAIAAVPVKPTIKIVTSLRGQASHKSQVTSVKETLDRRNLWEAQTPQVFKKEIILKAYKKFSRIDVTDDSMMVEKLGVRVSLVLGSYNNIKITTPEDLILAKIFLGIKN